MDTINEFVKAPESCSCDGKSCTKVSYQSADISVPIEIKPDVTVGCIEVECCGEPVVKREGGCHDACEFVLTQKINVKIPLKYDVYTRVGDSIVDCGVPYCCEQ